MEFAMKLVASKKMSLVNLLPESDRDTVSKAFTSGSTVTTKLITDDNDLQSYITRQTSLGYICHVFDYVESFPLTPVTKPFRATA
jgi:hypothetical protein